MKIKYFVYILLVLIFGYLIYNRISQDTQKGKNAKGGSSKSGESSSVIQAIVIQPEKFYNNITVSGTIEPNEQVKLRSEISGLVREINFAEGTTVQKGAVLIKIDDRELKAQLEQALTKENLASEVEDRARKLLKSEAISQEEYDNALAELKSLKAQTQLIRAQLSKTEIRAPFSGKIGLRSLSAGAYITPTSDIANLVSVNPVKLNFSIPEKYARRVKTGSHLSFSVAGNSRLFTATIYAIEPAIDINTRTLLLRAKAENENGELLPGTFANIQLPLETINDAILVPSEAIVPVLKGKQVYKVENGRTKAVDVYTDIRTDKEVLITLGLHKGDTVLISGLMSMAPDQEVNVKIVQKNQ